jgi:glycosyltransferase involved in cell wall biosynthesis
MNKPFVSVIVLTYHHAEYIAECLNRLQEQTYSPFEIVISDDASEDATPSLLEDLARSDDRIRFFGSDKNRGPAANFAFALSQCRGQVIATCEGDDLWIDAHKLSTQIEAMEETGAPLVYSNYCKIDSAGKMVRDRVLSQQPDRFTLADLLDKHGPATNSVVWKREVMPKIFPPDFFEVLNPDVFIIGYGLAAGNAAYVDKVFSAHREHSGGIWSGLKEFERGLIKYATLTKLYRTLGEEKLMKEALTRLERQLIMARERKDDLFGTYFSELPPRRRLALRLKWFYASLRSLDR